MSAPQGPTLYKGEPLDAERGPGLGCFWLQTGLLAFLLVFTPLTVVWAWDAAISAALLIVTLILLLFAGQTVIFLLRLVAVDRRSRRRPLAPDARPTVGQLEEPAVAAPVAEGPVAEGPEPAAEAVAEGARVEGVSPTDLEDTTDRRGAADPRGSDPGPVDPGVARPGDGPDGR